MRMVYMVMLDADRNLGNVIFEEHQAAVHYKNRCEWSGLKSYIIPRLMVTGDGSDFVFGEEISQAK